MVAANFLGVGGRDKNQGRVRCLQGFGKTLRDPISRTRFVLGGHVDVALAGADAQRRIMRTDFFRRERNLTIAAGLQVVQKFIVNGG